MDSWSNQYCLQIRNFAKDRGLVIIPSFYIFWHFHDFSIFAAAPLIAPSPAEVPSYKPSSPAALVTSNKGGKHTNLTLIVSIGAGFLVIAIVSVLIVCSCASRRGKEKASPVGIGDAIIIQLRVLMCTQQLIFIFSVTLASIIKIVTLDKPQVVGWKI